MRNKRETDISQYKKDIQQNELSEKADGGVKRFFRRFSALSRLFPSICTFRAVASSMRFV